METVVCFLGGAVVGAVYTWYKLPFWAMCVNSGLVGTLIYGVTVMWSGSYG